MLKKIKRWWFYTKLIWRGEPIRTWNKLENGKYMCDGDCRRWSMHGVCTCGLTHWFKPIDGGHDKIERDNISWRREGQTMEVMSAIDRVEFCHHNVYLNDKCKSCDEELEKSMEVLYEEMRKW